MKTKQTLGLYINPSQGKGYMNSPVYMRRTEKDMTMNLVRLKLTGQFVPAIKNANVDEDRLGL